MPTRTKKKAGSSKKSIQVDFSETESRGGKKGRGTRVHIPPGDYAVKVVKAEIGKSSEKETPGIFVTYKITQGKKKGTTVSDSLWLTSSALWRVRNALEAMGLKVPSRKIDVHPEKMVGKECGITVDDEEYDDKVYSRVVDTFLLSEMDAEDAELDTDEDDDEDEEEDDEDEDDEDEDEDDDEDEDEEDLDSIDI